MSQGTPMKEGRIERHLMRQRGAGVRTITADFGFAISFPSAPPVAQVHLPTEPPAKRRKTNESVSPGKSSASLWRSEPNTGGPLLKHATVQPGERPEQICHDEKENTAEASPTKEVVKPVKKTAKNPTKTRRKLRIEDEEREEHHKGTTPQAGLSEDTFIFGLKSSKRQPKQEPEESSVKNNADHTSKVVPAKVQRITKASRQADSKPIQQSVEQLSAGPELAVERPKPSRKKTAGKPITAVTSTASKPSEGMPEVDKTGDKLQNLTTFSATTHDRTKETTNTKSKAVGSGSVKAKTASRKANKRTIDEALEDANDATTNVPEKASKRPRRQAAISAIEKVTLSYEEDLVPTDKLRRAPDLETKTKRLRKAAALETPEASEHAPVTLPATPPKGHPECVLEESAPSEPQPKKRGRKKAVKDLDLDAAPLGKEVKSIDNQAGEHNLATATEPQPKRRGRKTAVQVVEEFDGGKAAGSPKANGPHQEEHNSSSKRKMSVIDAVSSHQKPLPAKRGQRPGGKAPNVDGDPTDTSSTGKDPGNGHSTENQSEAYAEVPNSRGKATEGSSRLAEPPPKESGEESAAKAPTKTRRALADFDGNIVRRPSVEPKKLDHSSSLLATQRSKPAAAKTQPGLEARPRGRPKKAQSDKQPANLLDIEQHHSIPRTTKKRHVISSSEDLDWLFEKAEPQRTTAASVRQTKPKGLGRKDLDRSAKEMDLDDLLESIAGFSGKLLTGQRGRSPVTK